MKILLTGGSGFLGSALAVNWLKAGHEVALLLRPASNTKRLQGLDSFFNIGRFTNDVEISAFVENVQPEVVVHNASTFGRQGETRVQLFDANIRIGLVIIQALKKVGHTVSFINAGSALRPEVSLYALAKNQFAHWGRMIATLENGDFKFINVLLQHVYGPNDDVSKFSTYVLHACYRNDPYINLTAGEQRRDFIYIDDAVSAYNILLTHCNQLDTIIDIEVGSGVAPTIRQFVETVHRITESNTNLLFGALPYRPNEAMLCLANLEYMKKLGWTPKFDINSGLNKTMQMEFKK